MSGLSMSRRRSSNRAPERRTALGELFVHEDVQGFEADGCGQRIAAEGAAVIARLKDRHHFAPGEKQGHGQDPAAQRLAEDEAVRPDPFVLRGQQAAGTAEARLYLVRDQQHVVPAAQLCRAPPGSRPAAR